MKHNKRKVPAKTLQPGDVIISTDNRRWTVDSLKIITLFDGRLSIWAKNRNTVEHFRLKEDAQIFKECRK